MSKIQTPKSDARLRLQQYIPAQMKGERRLETITLIIQGEDALLLIDALVADQMLSDARGFFKQGRVTRD